MNFKRYKEYLALAVGGIIGPSVIGFGVTEILHKHNRGYGTVIIGVSLSVAGFRIIYDKFKQRRNQCASRAQSEIINLQELGARLEPQEQNEEEEQEAPPNEPHLRVIVEELAVIPPREERAEQRAVESPVIQQRSPRSV